MVLGGILEYLLDGSRISGGEDDSPLGDGQQTIFPDTIGKVLGDACGQGGRQLMAVEPGRDPRDDTPRRGFPGYTGYGGKD